MSKASALEWQMLDLINAERVSRGLNPLKLELRLNDASEDHSRWMLNVDQFSHTGAGGSSPTERMRDANFDLSGSWRTAENIAWQSVRGLPGLADDVVNLHQSLMNSSGHRANILNPSLEVIGIGIERGNFKGWDAIFVTQNFAATDAPVQIDSRGTTTPAPTPPAPTPPVVDEDQRLVGTNGSNQLRGEGGNDTLIGNGGNDSLWGGDDNDRLEGNDGRDMLIGNKGNDNLYGQSGNDLLIGGQGNDALHGGTGRDKLIGKTGNDRLFGNADNDTLKGGRGDDQLDGGDQHDKLLGGIGKDTIEGGRGNDIIYGGPNGDTFVFENGHGNDHIFDFNPLSQAERIDLSGVTGFDSFQDVRGAATQMAGHVRIETGNDSSILLVNVSLSDLDASDFLF